MKIKSLLVILSFILCAFQCENENTDENTNENTNNQQVFTPEPWAYGSGTSNDPYIIENAEQLVYLSLKVNDTTSTEPEFSDNRFYNKFFKVVNDIDMSNISFTPIGFHQPFPFGGHFDGNNLVISNLTITTNHQISNSIEMLNYNHANGLFGYFDKTLKNINLVNCHIQGKKYVGGIAGFQFGSVTSQKIENCHVTGQIVSEFYAGGIVGWSNGKVEKSSFESGNISGPISGGISGHLNSSGFIEQCYNLGTVTGTNHNYSNILYDFGAGGISGTSYGGKISECFNKGNVNGYLTSGGIVGYWDGPNTSNSLKNHIIYCYNSANIFSNSYVGGITGYHSSGDINNSFNIGYLSSNNSNYVAALAYNSSSSTIQQCYFLFGITENQFQFDMYYGLQESEMKTPNLVNQLNNTFSCGYCPSDQRWTIDPQGLKNNGFPYLIWED